MINACRQSSVKERLFKGRAIGAEINASQGAGTRKRRDTWFQVVLLLTRKIDNAKQKCTTRFLFSTLTRQPCSASKRQPILAELAILVQKHVNTTMKKTTEPQNMQKEKTLFVTAIILAAYDVNGAKTKTNHHLVVGPDCRGLPPSVVPARVAVVELEAVVLVPAGEEERHAERPKTPELCVRLEKHHTGEGCARVRRKCIKALGDLLGDLLVHIEQNQNDATGYSHAAKHLGFEAKGCDVSQAHGAARAPPTQYRPQKKPVPPRRPRTTHTAPLHPAGPLCFRCVTTHSTARLPTPAHLLVIADLLDQLLQGHLLSVLVEVPLRRHPRVVHQEVCVRRQTRHHAGGVLVQPAMSRVK